MSLYSYYVGVDLGSRQDFTAITVVEEPVWIAPESVEPGRGGWSLGPREPGWASPASLDSSRLDEFLSDNLHHGRPGSAP